MTIGFQAQTIAEKRAMEAEVQLENLLKNPSASIEKINEIFKKCNRLWYVAANEVKELI